MLMMNKRKAKNICQIKVGSRGTDFPSFKNLESLSETIGIKFGENCNTYLQNPFALPRWRSPHLPEIQVPGQTILKAHKIILKAHKAILKTRKAVLKTHKIIMKTHKIIMKTHKIILKTHKAVFKTHMAVLKAHKFVFKTHKAILKTH
jgi:hypothetical protein